MTKILHCRDAGFDCDAVIRGDTVEDILAQVRPHAAAEHGVSVDAGMESQLAGLVGEE
jgi:predicted small metal-binding protein